MYERVISHGCT